MPRITHFARNSAASQRGQRRTLRPLQRLKSRALSPAEARIIRHREGSHAPDSEPAVCGASSCARRSCSHSPTPAPSSARVKDTSGAVIPHATVTITNQQTDRRTPSTTNLEGRYTSLPLPPGEYRVEAGLQGFRRAARADVVRPDQRHGRHRLHPRSRRPHRRSRGPRQRHAARDDQRHGRQGRRQPPHPRAAAEYAQRLLADLPDAGRRRHDRQQLQLDELQRERRPADDDGYRDRRRDGLLSRPSTGSRAFRCFRRSTPSRNSRCSARTTRRNTAAASAAS